MIVPASINFVKCSEVNKQGCKVVGGLGRLRAYHTHSMAERGIQGLLCRVWGRQREERKHSFVYKWKISGPAHWKLNRGCLGGSNRRKLDWVRG